MSSYSTNIIPNIKDNPLPVVIIGAGPVGLAAAAHALEEGLDPIIFEAGKSVGDSILDWGHVRLFSPWRFNLNNAAERLLAGSGWETPDLDALPTGQELVEKYLQPLAAHPEIAPRLQLHTKVLSVTREGRDKVIDSNREQLPFSVRIQQSDGNQTDIKASAVIDASGTWKTPNPLGAGGVLAVGEAENAEHIHYGIPDILGRNRHRYEGKTIVVVGAGHSAANALLDLATLAEQDPETKIVWAVRGKNLSRIFGGGENDQLPARGELGDRLKALTDSGALTLYTEFSIASFQADGTGGVNVSGTGPDGMRRISGVDRVIATTGARPNLDIIREVRTELDSSLESVLALAPLIDPNVHSCGTIRPHGAAELSHSEPGFFIVGMKSYGRAPTFLMATGYEQVRSVFAALVGDIERAADVQLELPETGVCSSNVEGVVCCAGGADTPVSEFSDKPETSVASEPEAQSSADCGCGCG